MSLQKNPEAAQMDDPRDTARLLSLVYDELKRLAACKMAGEAAGHTLQPTALVHEAWLRLAGSEQQTWENRAHFFGAAAEAMRRILIEGARRKQARRHGGGQQRVDIEEVQVTTKEADEALLAVNEALEKFALEDKEKAELVKLRYFGGLSFEEAAEVLNVSVPTAKRWWAYSRAWLYEEIQSGKQR